MERMILYGLALADVAVGCLLYWRGSGRFGLMTYRSYLRARARRLRP